MNNNFYTHPTPSRIVLYPTVTIFNLPTCSHFSLTAMPLSHSHEKRERENYVQSVSEIAKKGNAQICSKIIAVSSAWLPGQGQGSD